MPLFCFSNKCAVSPNIAGLCLCCTKFICVMMSTCSALAQQFVQQYLSAAFLHLGLIVLVFWVCYRLLYATLQFWRIQQRQQWNRQQILRELKNAIYTLAVSTSLSLLVLYLSQQGYTRLYYEFEAHPFWSVFGFFLFLIFDDAWFYWMHRLLHHPRLYPYIHLEHHKSVDVIPSTALSFHWLEPLLLTLWIVPASFLLPTYMPALILVQLWGLFDNIKSHLGLEIYPAWWNRSGLRWLTSSTHHNMHHSQVQGNYGVHFRWWDRIMGTEFAHYESTFDAVQTRKKEAIPPTAVRSQDGS